MRFREFATPVRPVLKISQQANTPESPLPSNTPPTAASPVHIRVYPRAWQHEWVQKYLAAKIAKSAQTIKPTTDDMALAFFRYGEAQSQADAEYERSTGETAVDRRWVKRD